MLVKLTTKTHSPAASPAAALSQLHSYGPPFWSRMKSIGFHRKAKTAIKSTKATQITIPYKHTMLIYKKMYKFNVYVAKWSENAPTNPPYEDTVARAHAHTHTRAHALTRVHTHTHARKHTRTHTHTHARTYTGINFYTHTREREHSHTHARTHAHAHTHTHKQTQRPQRMKQLYCSCLNLPTQKTKTEVSLTERATATHSPSSAKRQQAHKPQT